jgi:SAM-dependent methyltransferase
MPVPRFYQQPSLFVGTYDVLNSPEKAGMGVEGDVEFYRSLASEQGGPILELACGTGRVAFPLAEGGFRVVGVDRSRPMLAVAESKHRAANQAVASRLEFVEGDMRDFQLHRTFQAVATSVRTRARGAGETPLMEPRPPDSRSSIGLSGSARSTLDERLIIGRRSG